MASEDTTTLTAGETVPSSWPGAFGIFKYSRKAVQTNAWPIVGIALLYILTSAIFSNLGPASDPGRYGSSTTHPGSLITYLVSVLLSTAFALVLIAGVRGTKLSMGEALKKSVPLYFKALGLAILTILIATASFLLLVIPFFIIMPRLELAQYFLVDKNLGPIQALQASWKATKGNVLIVWGIWGATLVMALLILLLIGLYFVIMYMAAIAVLYVYLADGENLATSETLSAIATPPTPSEAQYPVAGLANSGVF